MLCLVAAQSQLLHPAFHNVVTASADAIFRIVAAPSQFLYLVAVQGHHLAHTDVAQRNAHRAEQFIGIDGVGGIAVICIPVSYGVLRIGQFVLLSVGELKLLVMPAAFQFALGRNAHNALIVNHPAVVLEEGAVLARHIDQHTAESVLSRAIDRCPVGVSARLGPQGRLCTPGIAVARAAAVSRIYGTQSVARVHGVVIQAVAMCETPLIGRDIGHPVGIRVIGKAGVLENSGGAGREGIAIWHLYVGNIQNAIILTAPKGHENDACKGMRKCFFSVSL